MPCDKNGKGKRDRKRKVKIFYCMQDVGEKKRILR